MVLSLQYPRVNNDLLRASPQPDQEAPYSSLKFDNCFHLSSLDCVVWFSIISDDELIIVHGVCHWIFYIYGKLFSCIRTVGNVSGDIDVSRVSLIFRVSGSLMTDQLIIVLFIVAQVIELSAVAFDLYIASIYDVLDFATLSNPLNLWVNLRPSLLIWD